MGTLAEIRAGIKTRLATITGLRPFAYMPNVITPPTAWPMPFTGNDEADFEGDQTLIFDLVIVSGPAQGDFERGQKALDLYLEPSGTYSIEAAIVGDVSLGGKADSTAWKGWSNYGVLEIPLGSGNHWWGATARLEVYQ